MQNFFGIRISVPRVFIPRMQANDIARRYSKWMPMKDIQKFYDELAAIGITVGMLTDHKTRCEWYYHGALVENSLFNLTCYRGTADSDRAEYNIYFS